jgi:hypothetical protein
LGIESSAKKLAKVSVGKNFFREDMEITANTYCHLHLYTTRARWRIKSPVMISHFLMIRVLYKYRVSKEAEAFVRKIESDQTLGSSEFVVASVDSFETLWRLTHNLDSELLLVVIEMGRSELQKTMDYIRRVNKAVREKKRSFPVGTLVLFVAREPAEIADALTTNPSTLCMIRRDPDAVVERLYELRRLLRRIHVKGLVRIAVNRDGTVKIWVVGADGVEHEFSPSSKLKQLVFCLAKCRYANKEVIAKWLEISSRSAKAYVKRLREAFDRFNAEETHIRTTGKELFQTIHYADEDIYRIRAAILLDEEKAA